MKRLLMVLALVIMAMPVMAQDHPQLNVGVAARRFSATPVLDAVLMQPVLGFYLYEQTTVTDFKKKPEISVAVEIPIFDEYKHFYLGFDTGLTIPITDVGKYGRGVSVFGLTSWMPVTKTAGFYWMLSKSPEQKGGATFQGGVFKQVF